MIKDIIHESGRGAPIAKVQFQNTYRFQRDNENMVAVEGTYSGQFIYAGKKGEWMKSRTQFNDDGNDDSGINSTEVWQMVSYG